MLCRGCYSIFHTATGENDLDKLQLFLDSEANVNAQSGFYGHKLQAAAFNGKVEGMRLLLDEGAGC